jgi:hypothetical protein
MPLLISSIISLAQALPPIITTANAVATHKSMRWQRRYLPIFAEQLRSMPWRGRESRRLRINISTALVRLHDFARAAGSLHKRRSMAMAVGQTRSQISDANSGKYRGTSTTLSTGRGKRTIGVEMAECLKSRKLSILLALPTGVEPVFSD